MKRAMWLVQTELVATAIGMTAATVMLWQAPVDAYLISGEAGQCFTVTTDQSKPSSKFCESTADVAAKQNPKPAPQAKPVEPPTQPKSRQNLGLMLRLLNLKQEIGTWIS
jgi:hypothetical protein